jgi:tight adherence protein C
VSPPAQAMSLAADAMSAVAWLPVAGAVPAGAGPPAPVVPVVSLTVLVLAVLLAALSADPAAVRRGGRGRLAGPAAVGRGGRGRAAAAAMLAVVAAAAAPGLGVVLLGLAAAGLVAARAARRRTVARRLAARVAAAPAVLDLLGAGLLAGLNPHLAVLRVAERAPDALREELAEAAAVLRLGGTPAAALRAAAERTGLDELRAAAGALEAAERWGAPPAEALAARAEALRSRARLRADAEAGRAAVRLAFPLVLCFLPAFVLLTVVPTVAGALRTLTP